MPHRSIALALVTLVSPAVGAQTVSYAETFDTRERGVRGSCGTTGVASCSTSDFTDTDWTLTGDTEADGGSASIDDLSGLTNRFDYVQTVPNGFLEFQDTDQGVCWNAPQLGAGFVRIEVELFEASDLEAEDYVDVEWSVDGGEYQTVEGAAGTGHTLVGDSRRDGMADDEDWGGADGYATVFSPAFEATTSIDVRVCVLVDEGDERVLIDAVIVGQPPLSVEALPPGVTVGPASPNPAVGSARLGLTMAAPEHVTVTVVDALGRTVATAFEGLSVGERTVTLATDALPAGTYHVRVEAETFSATRPLVVVR